MLKEIKRTTLQAARGAGFFRLSRESAWRSKRLLILCYHAISLEDEHEWNSEFYIHPAFFEARMRMLHENGYIVLPLDEALHRLASESLPERSVALTFDDGMYDFYKQAYPVLRQYGFPATVYLTTYYCENNLPIFRLICSFMLWKKRGEVFESGGLPGMNGVLDLRTAAGRGKALENLERFAAEQKLGGSQKNELAQQLAGALRLDFAALCAQRFLHLMNPQEVAELSRAGIDFQLHTHRHRSPHDQDSFAKEIRDNRRKIEEFTGKLPVHFCYPSGVTRPPYPAWLAAENVISATTTVPGLADRQANPHLLPRLVDHLNLAPIEFESWLTGFSSFVPRRKRPNEIDNHHRM